MKTTEAMPKQYDPTQDQLIAWNTHGLRVHIKDNETYLARRKRSGRWITIKLPAPDLAEHLIMVAGGRDLMVQVGKFRGARLIIFSQPINRCAMSARLIYASRYLGVRHTSGWMLSTGASYFICPGYRVYRQGRLVDHTKIATERKESTETKAEGGT